MECLRSGASASERAPEGTQWEARGSPVERPGPSGTMRHVTAIEGPVAPGTGWPGDRADPGTPVAAGADQVERLARAAPDLGELDARVSVCRACPRLVGWREEVARVKRAAFADQRYWGRPAPGFGDPQARIAILGLAPAAHGANRTG